MEYLAQLGEGGLRRRAERLYQKLDLLQQLRREARCELIAECRKQAATKWLQSVPFLGPIRAAVLIGRVQTPHRFRTKRQFRDYCGLAIETRDSAEYRVLPNTASDDFISLTMLVRTESWVWNDRLPPIFQTRRKARRDQKRLIREPLLA